MLNQATAGTRALLVVSCALLAVALPGDARPARSETTSRPAEARRPLYADPRRRRRPSTKFLKRVLPSFMPAISPVLARGEYLINPAWAGWGGNVGLTLPQQQIGRLTGQRTIDGLLSALDVAWKQAPGRVDARQRCRG